MELVPWTYNNPRVDRSKLEKQQFIFRGKIVEIFQDVTKEIDVTKNTAFKLWDGAYLLAKFIEETSTNGYFPPDFWKDKRCVDLGAGCGLLGTVAWLLGSSVTLTDIPEALSHLRNCVQKNCGVDSDRCDTADTADVAVKPLVWGEPISPDILSASVDIVLGSDIVYHPKLNKRLVRTIDEISSSNTITLISYKPRGLQEEHFFPLLDSKGFECIEVEEVYHPNDFKGSDYKIFKIQRRA